MDFYTALAAEALKKPYDAVTTEERERAKAYWYARLYDSNTNLRYINRFTFRSANMAQTFITTVSLDKMPVLEEGGKVVVYTFDNPHDAYISLCEAYNSGVHIGSISCGTELPQ